MRVEMFFEKEGAVKNAGIHFEIGDVGIFINLHLGLKKTSCRGCLLFWSQKIASNSFLGLLLKPGLRPLTQTLKNVDPEKSGL